MCTQARSLLMDLGSSDCVMFTRERITITSLDQATSDLAPASRKLQAPSHKQRAASNKQLDKIMKIGY